MEVGFEEFLHLEECKGYNSTCYQALYEGG